MRFRFFEKKLGKKLPCMAVAQRGYSLIYMKNDWATAMQESFCGAFLEKRQRVPVLSR